jgi:hypothetical protein
MTNGLKIMIISTQNEKLKTRVDKIV